MALIFDNEAVSLFLLNIFSGDMAHFNIRLLDKVCLTDRRLKSTIEYKADS